MGLIAKTIENIINIAIFLAMIGGLKSATLYFAEKVAQQHKRGLVSLTSLNYQLMGHKTFCANISWPDKRCDKPKSRKTKK
ncbi:MAG: hypothetical protein H6625_06780 [Bdellovibrionaceae bacterium]|nr:hypothetical protein [Pseudobdellovibrionaceae bacterium]MCB9093223.1 hypothetical protein [Halobacteriovoraceae bacterium]